jgi:poly-gamma-glutamate synthesis protein (capsule biosynthesis protein)
VGVAAVGLANNHALDFGTGALLDTLELLETDGIEAAGAGTDCEAARRGVILERAGARVGLLAVSDHPREYTAGEDQPGIAYADLTRNLPRWMTAELGRLREQADHVIAFPHWGPNMNAQTVGWQRRAAAKLLDAGANLVAGHSAHVFHGIGWEGDGPVLYDLGDALDDYAVDRRLRNDLGVLALWLPGSAEAPIELVGLRLHYRRTELAYGGDADWISTRLADACLRLGTSVERLGEQRFRVTPV